MNISGNIITRKYSPIRIIVLGFFITILIGGILLSLPFCNNKPITLIDSFFIATSATCVTGHSTLNIVEQFTGWGHLILMILMEIGGLGFVLIMAWILLLFKRKISFSERMLLREALGKESLAGMVKLITKILKFTIIIQLLGAIALMIEFIPEYGVTQGIFNSCFCAVSFFCNAGFDITNIGQVHIFQTSVLVNVVIVVLTILGGIGFIIWDDIDNKIRKGKHHKFSIRKTISTFNVYTKIVLITYGVLIVIGAVGIYALETNNTATIGNLATGDKALVSILHSITSRSTGIATIEFMHLRDATKLLTMCLMFIGGASGGTSGGIKVSTFAIMILVVQSLIREKKEVSVFGREISSHTIKRAFCIMFTYISVIIVALICLAIVEPSHNIIDIGLETVSAIGTVGLSTGILGTFSILGKLIVMFLMFLGRVGTITLALTFIVSRPKESEGIRYPQEKVIVVG